MAGGTELSPDAKLLYQFIQRGSRDEVDAADLEIHFKKERWEVVRDLRELDAAGLGRFIPGRHGYSTRFSRGASSTPQIEIRSTIQDAHVYVLKRDNPVRISLPSDITRAEADRITRWVNALPDD